MSENLNETLSALMDDEATELELRRVLKHSADDTDLLETWQRYHLLRDVLHDPSSRRPAGNILAGVQSALADEAAHSATGSTPRQAPETKRFAGVGRAFGQGAVAATVALGVLFSVHSLRSPESPPSAMVAGGTAASGSAQLSANTNARYVEGEFNRTVSFNTEDRTLDNQSRDRLRRAVIREFEQYSSAPQYPVLQVSSPPQE